MQKGRNAVALREELAQISPIKVVGALALTAGEFTLHPSVYMSINVVNNALECPCVERHIRIASSLHTHLRSN
jgi:hypothetical protein